MGISSTTNRVTYLGDGSTLPFSFPFYFAAKADLVVYVYDTLLGGLTLKTINTDYTISGSVNAQGLYPSGGTVTFIGAPLSTDIVVLFRSPSQVQNYTLLQNGVLNTTALIQQLDYMTLLIQRLQDEATRSTGLRDGVGATFDAKLPSTLALNPGAAILVNAAGDGLSIGTPNNQAQPALWIPYTFSYTAFQTAALTNLVTALTLPAAGLLSGIAIKTDTVFAGTSISALDVKLGITADHGKFINNFDLLGAVSSSNFDTNIGGYVADWSATTPITMFMTAVGANLSALTQGQLTIWAQYWQL